MTVTESIQGRRSIRKYTDRQIPREELEAIVEAGTYAPNAGGGQRHLPGGMSAECHRRRHAVCHPAK